MYLNIFLQEAINIIVIKMVNCIVLFIVNENNVSLFVALLELLTNLKHTGG